MIKATHKAVIGLGNPGPRFDLTPHNAGYAVLDALARAHDAEFEKKRLATAETADITVSGVTLTLVKPTTGMNDSGLALRDVLDVLGFDFPEILVIFDDLSLPLGKMRFRDSGRQSAGHNGVKSLFQFVPEVRLLSRLKLGIGPDPGGENRLDYVLSPMPEARRHHYAAVLGAAAEGVQLWTNVGLLAAMNRFNALEVSA